VCRHAHHNVHDGRNTALISRRALCQEPPQPARHPVAQADHRDAYARGFINLTRCARVCRQESHQHSMHDQHVVSGVISWLVLLSRYAFCDTGAPSLSSLLNMSAAAVRHGTVKSKLRINGDMRQGNTQHPSTNRLSQFNLYLSDLRFTQVRIWWAPHVCERTYCVLLRQCCCTSPTARFIDTIVKLCVSP
jgi:hypothetical protein